MKTDFRILMVEDDPDLAAAFADGLEEDGFTVSVASTVQQGLDLARSKRPDAIMVDIVLPDGSGLSLIRKLRAQGTTEPILALTARGDTSTTVAALDSGADAYVIKPAAIEAVGARLRALLRRTPGSSGDRLQVGILTYEPDRLAGWVGDTEIDLTPVQSRILTVLMENSGRVISRSQLMSRVWTIDRMPMSNVIDVHIKAIRSKMGDVEGAPDIESIRGVGYRIRPGG